jgi:pyruvate dehydrogenase kinase 2/3/4
LQTLTRTGRGELLDRTEQNTPNPADFPSRHIASPEVLLQVASFIHHEMPIRLARRIKDLDNVPYLSQMNSVQAVKDIYISSFLSLIKEPKIESNVREALFARKLELLYERHSSVLVQIAKGAYELREKIRTNQIEGLDTESFEQMNECHAFLDRFYMSRIGIRVLAGQYLTLRSPTMDGYIGLIYQYCSPYDVVKLAVTDASYMCENKYGTFPEVVISGNLNQRFAYIPTQLHYIILELLKNAMRATVEHHGSDPRKWPPVEVVIADGDCNEDVVLKISDEGGGIPRSHRKKIWSYLFTTADPAIQDSLVGLQNKNDHSVDAPLAGLGYGLPISRSYARYFGGDISIESMEGYGSDAYVHLRRLGDSREPLPL